METTACDSCGGASAEEDHDACVDCDSTGKRHEDCNDCGERFEWESGYGSRCAPCYSRIYGAASRGSERDWDAENDARRDDSMEESK